MDQPVILFDGICNLCNGAVKFVINHDKKEYFLFASLQSAFAQKTLAVYDIQVNELNSFILIKNKKIYTRSTGALMVVKELNGVWGLLYVFIIFPKFMRDAVYNMVAKKRYKWFGKTESCMVPAHEIKARFLD